MTTTKTTKKKSTVAIKGNELAALHCALEQEQKRNKELGKTIDITRQRYEELSERYELALAEINRIHSRNLWQRILNL